MENFPDTIAAIATPPGKGGVGIIRVSGSEAVSIAKQISKFKSFKARHCHFSNFYDSNQNIIDQGIIVFFPGPNSFTGEDVIEFQGHGGPIILDELIQEIISSGARIAKPGEFSERAFLNDKLDLTQAEAIADLIDAGSKQAARAAINSLQGEFSKTIAVLQEDLTRLRMYIEAAIDFPEEEIDFLADKKINQSIKNIKESLHKIISNAQQGNLLNEGIQLVIIGKPNAGKSSLLNSLSGQDSAIVTDIPGTTRDILKEYIQIDGLPLHIIDTAGLRESDDVVEKIGIERAKKAVDKADFILFLIDALDYSEIKLDSIIKQWGLDNKKVFFVKNKIDLTKEKPQTTKQENYDVISISARTGLGLDGLKSYIKKRVGFSDVTEGVFLARRRHIDALNRTLEFVKTGEKQLEQHQAGELLAEDLRQAQICLSEITGEFTSDDLLGEIFSKFCIGK